MQIIKLLNIVFMDEIIGTLMWRINDEAEGRIVNATTRSSP